MRRLLAGAVLAISALAGPAVAGEQPPLITLIIDDMAHDVALARRVLALPRPFAVSILPDSPLARDVHAAAVMHEIDVMAHVPMEAGGHAHAGSRTLSGRMSSESLRRAVRRALSGLPGAIAVNNHQGSRVTANAEAMAAVMAELGEHDGMMFIDSRTTADSVAQREALSAGLPATRRDVFLDHLPDRRAVDRAVDRWLATARRRGCALAIAHPREATLEVLERRLPAMDGDVDRVDLATYIQQCGGSHGRKRS